MTTLAVPRPASLLALASALAACSGADPHRAPVADPPQASVDTVSLALSSSALPDCTPGHDGDVTYVFSEGKFYACKGATTAWVSVSARGFSGLAKLTPITGGAQCAAGGVEIAVGLDANENGQLDSSEVTARAPVCNGIAGAPGKDGKDGLDGRDGVDGKDGTDGTDGVNGVDGVDGANGIDGADGVDGRDGADGLSSLIVTAVEPSGPHCANGGVRVNAGLDVNGDGALGPDEVRATNYVCNAPATSALAFAVGGTVENLWRGSLRMTNGAESVRVDANGAFAFTTPMPQGATYDVQITEQPDAQVCTIGGNTGVVVGSDVTTVRVDCTRNVRVARAENVTAVAASTGAVYWGSSAGLSRAALDGSAPTVLVADAAPTSIVVRDGFVYWADQNRSIERIPVAGGSPNVLAANQCSDMRIALDGFAVNWTCLSAQQLRKTPFAGGGVGFYPTTLPGVSAIHATPDGALFWGATGLVGAFTGSQVMVAANQQGTVPAVWWTQGYLVWIGQDGGRVSAGGFGGTPPRTLWVASKAEAIAAFDDGNYYFTDSVEGTVRHGALPTFTSPEVIAANQSAPRFIAVGDDQYGARHVYWSATDGVWMHSL